MEAFLAIDIETAGAQRASACAIGWSKFEHGIQTDAGSTLIDPQMPPEEWNAFNISIHGIEPRDVIGAPDFKTAWGEVNAIASGVPLVAHNAAFDIGVIRAELLRFNVSPRPFRYTCSAALARSAWPEMLSVSLPIVADELGIELDHHDPCSDAQASAQILVEAVRVLGGQTIADAFASTNRRWGEVRPDLSWSSGGGSNGLRAKDLTPRTAEFDADHPLFDQVVVFTGALQSMTRREAFQHVLDVGGQPADGVTKHTNVLVVGEQDIKKLAEGQAFSAKQRKAATRRTKGQDIQMVGELEFLRLL